MPISNVFSVNASFLIIYKNPAHRRHRICQPMRIEAPIQKDKSFLQQVALFTFFEDFWHFFTIQTLRNFWGTFMGTRPSHTKIGSF